MRQPNYYDNIADIYDQTRWLTESIAEDVADFMLALVKATPETTFLEPGVGTGLKVMVGDRSFEWEGSGICFRRPQ